MPARMPLKKINNKALNVRGGAVISGELATKIFTGIFAFNGGLTIFATDAVGKGCKVIRLHVY